MLNQSSLDSYLHSMGIVRFVERKQTMVSFSIHTRTGLLTLVSEILGASALLQEQLWSNIIDSLQHINVAHDLHASDHIIILGQNAATKIKTIQNSEITYSLEELIEQPQHKAEVWDVIKNKIMGSC